MNIKKERILSGMRPTGKLHLGNYFGALENWVKLQDEYKCYYSIVDWHALTTDYENTDNIKNNIKELLLDWLSAGIDPNKSIVFVQSHVKQHAELNLLFSMITPISWLERCPTYKDQILQLKDKNIANYGFLGYPVLQTADIAIYKANKVPVGEDQLPHLEMAREIIRRFNYLYKGKLPEPQAILTKAKILPGIDGRKMSKSYNNTIELGDSPEESKKKIKKIKTDPSKIRKNDPGKPEICTVYSFHKLLTDSNQLDDINDSCMKGILGCVDCKNKLYISSQKVLMPIYEKRLEISKKPNLLDEILNEGKKKAEFIAEDTMHEIRNHMNI